MSARTIQLRALAAQHHGEFEVNFSTITVMFATHAAADGFMLAVRRYDRTIGRERDQHEGRVRVTLSLG